MMEYWIAGAVAWAVCGFLAYGLDLAHFHRGWPTLADRDRDEDISCARAAALLGPIALIVGLIMYKGRGFMWRLPPREP